MPITFIAEVLFIVKIVVVLLIVKIVIAEVKKTKLLIELYNY